MQEYKIYDVYKEQIDKIIHFFLSESIDPVFFEKIKTFCISNQILDKTPNHSAFLNLGYLTADDFLIYISANNLIGNGIKTGLVENILKLLSREYVISKQESQSFYNLKPMYKSAGEWAKYLHDNGLILNIIFGFFYIIKNYKNSVLKIEHTKENGDKNIGTGFFIRIKNEKSETINLIITNQHVVHNAKSIRVENENGEEINFNNIEESIDKDIALIFLNDNKMDDVQTFAFNFDYEILEDIVTIGYPPVASTKDAYQLCHKGEINSLVEDYYNNEYIIFSAKNNPGNSGGPIIDRCGRVCGMVTQNFEHQDWYLTSKLPYHAAVNSKDIYKFIADKIK